MALILKGMPFTKIGEVRGNCEEDDLTTKDYCTSCRQFKKWVEKSTNWFSGTGESRVKAIFRAILEGHDDILSAFCGNCWVQTTETCECFISKYISVGFSTTLEVLTGYDDCVRLGQKLTVVNCGNSTDWFWECVPQVCETCVPRVLDPCNVPADRALMEKLYEAEMFRLNNRPTGDNILNQVARLFDGSTPTIVGTELGVVYIYLGRAMTPEEIQLRQIYASLVPLPDFGEIRFAEPAT